jgi:hypothetical protein
MKLKYENLNDQMLSQAIQRLGQSPLQTKVAYNISKIGRKLGNHLTDLRSKYKVIVDKYSEKDENGKIAQPDGSSIKLKKESVEDFNKETKELFETEIELKDCWPINMDDISEAKITPFELEALEPLLVDLSKIKGAKHLTPVPTDPA